MSQYDNAKLRVCLEFTVQSAGRDLPFQELEDKSREISRVLEHSELDGYMLTEQHYSFDDNVITLNFDVSCGLDLDEGDDVMDAEIFISEMIDKLSGPFSEIGCKITESDVHETDYMPQTWHDDFTMS